MLTFSKTEDSLMLALVEYPNMRLSDALNKLSILGKCVSAPTDNKPNADWVWAFTIDMEPAVRRLIEKHNPLSIENKNGQN